ncbi:MAG: methyltransferase domain-containing protein [Candidatus Dojkabacteria bacterium]|nr:methyltransferase domain-containing protein [Candidatus Dojkabacteria bacterium]MDQ7021437.1 methyltransferase domain-containing protein [Candidatus Dojkabacteria bacterium]
MPTNIKLPRKDSADSADDSTIKHKDRDRIIQNITFFGDSAIPEGDPIYKSVWELSKALAERGYTVVDGGGPGLMKAATDGAESVGGETQAVYWEPKLASFFEGKNLANVTDKSSASSNYVNRTFGLIERGDAYIVCKGGTGTVSEFGLVWALSKLYYGCHKPVILFGDFWEDLIEAFQKALYIDETELGVLYKATTPEEVLAHLTDHEQKIQHCKLENITGDETAFILSPRMKRTTETYEAHTSSYHKTYAGKLVAQEQLDEFITMVNPPARVLDIGCGPGFDTKYLSEKYSMKALDISKRMVEIAQYENPGVDVEYCDVVERDLGENIYKGIWSRGALHHIEGDKLDKVFANIAKALVEDGIFYLIVREGEGEEMKNDNKEYGDVERFYHLFSEDELRDRAIKADLKVVKIGHIKRSHKWITAVFRN